MNSTQLALVKEMRNGDSLILTYQSGSFLLEREGRPSIHHFWSDVMPLASEGVIVAGEFVGTPPGGHRVYRLNPELALTAAPTTQAVKP